LKWSVVCPSPQAVEQLNIKPKFWKDLLTDTPFTRKDIIHIQDPLNLSNRTLDNYHHVQAGLAAQGEAEPDPLSGINASKLSEDALRILGKLNTEESAKVGARFYMEWRRWGLRIVGRRGGEGEGEGEGS
jgi:peptidyl-prolyl cis-trans isomerase-like 2